MLKIANLIFKFFHNKGSLFFYGIFHSHDFFTFFHCSKAHLVPLPLIKLECISFCLFALHFGLNHFVLCWSDCRHLVNTFRYHSLPSFQFYFSPFIFSFVFCTAKTHLTLFRCSQPVILGPESGSLSLRQSSASKNGQNSSEKSLFHSFSSLTSSAAAAFAAVLFCFSSIIWLFNLKNAAAAVVVVLPGPTLSLARS